MSFFPQFCPRGWFWHIRPLDDFEFWCSTGSDLHIKSLKTNFIRFMYLIFYTLRYKSRFQTKLSKNDTTVKTWMSDNAPPWIPIYLLSNTNKLRCGCLARQNKSFLNKIIEFKCTISPESTIWTSSSPLCYSFSYENYT